MKYASAVEFCKAVQPGSWVTLQYSKDITNKDSATRVIAQSKWTTRTGVGYENIASVKEQREADKLNGIERKHHNSSYRVDIDNMLMYSPKSGTYQLRVSNVPSLKKVTTYKVVSPDGEVTYKENLSDDELAKCSKYFARSHKTPAVQNLIIDKIDYINYGGTTIR